MRIDIVLIILILALVMLGGSFVDGVQTHQKLSDAIAEINRLKSQKDALLVDYQSCELETSNLQQEISVLRQNAAIQEQIQTQSCLNNNHSAVSSTASWILQAAGLISLVGMQVITNRSRNPTRRNRSKLDEKPGFILLSKEERHMIIRQRRKSG